MHYYNDLRVIFISPERVRACLYPPATHSLLGKAWDPVFCKAQEYGLIGLYDVAHGEVGYLRPARRDQTYFIYTESSEVIDLIMKKSNIISRVYSSVIGSSMFFRAKGFPFILLGSQEKAIDAPYFSRVESEQELPFGVSLANDFVAACNFSLKEVRPEDLYLGGISETSESYPMVRDPLFTYNKLTRNRYYTVDSKFEDFLKVGIELRAKICHINGKLSMLFTSEGDGPWVYYLRALTDSESFSGDYPKSFGVVENFFLEMVKPLDPEWQKK